MSSSSRFLLDPAPAGLALVQDLVNTRPVAPYGVRDLLGHALSPFPRVVAATIGVPGFRRRRRLADPAAHATRSAYSGCFSMYDAT